MFLLTCSLAALLFQRVSALSQSVAKPEKFSAAEGSTFYTVWGWKLVSSYLCVYNMSVESPGGFCSLWSHVGSSRSCLESALHIRRLTRCIYTGTWGGCWKTQWEGMCLVLKQWSWSCFEELWFCVCREQGEFTHPNRKWGFLGCLFLKDLKRNDGAEFLLFRVLLHPPGIFSFISGLYWLLQNHTQTWTRPACLNLKKGMFIDYFSLERFLKLCHKARLWENLFLSWNGLQSNSRRSKKFWVQGKWAFSWGNKNGFVFFTPASHLWCPFLHLKGSPENLWGCEQCVCAIH